MIVKSLLGVFLVILLAAVTEQAPWSDEHPDRPAFSDRVEEFLDNLNHDGLDDSEKIKYLGEILIALSYYKYNDPNYLQHCAGQKIVQDGYRDIQRQPYDEQDDEYEEYSSTHDSYDRGVDGHRTQDDHDYSDLAEYDDDAHHRGVIDESEDHELAGGRQRGHGDEDDDDEYSRDHHYGHDGSHGARRESNRRGGSQGYNDGSSTRGGDAGSRSRGNQEHSYDPYSGQRAPAYSESDEYEHSGDYNSQNQQYSSSPSSNYVDHYLHLIQLQGVPSDLAQYAETYLQHAKNTIRTYGYQAKDFEKIRPCLESVVKYFNLLNIDLAKEYNRCKRQCYLDRLSSYTTAISQYTVTTSACINSRMH